MRLERLTNHGKRALLIAALMLAGASFYSNVFAQSAPNINVDAKLAPDHVGRGRTVRGTVTLDIPSGYHINSNRPLEKFLIPTQLKIDAPNGVRVSATSYPRALIRTLKFSKNKVAVFEGRATMRFTVVVPANFSGDSAELRGRLRYQSCSDDVCFPPRSVDVSMRLRVE